MKMNTAADVKRYEISEYRKAVMDGTSKAWKRYRANVKREVTKYNNTHDEQININALMA